MEEKKKKQTKWDSFQTESICASKDTVRKVKGQLTEWEKILERHISERDLYPQYIKNSDNSTMKKQTTQFKNGQKGFPSWLCGKESACQCRRHGFDPWSGKIPRAVEQLSLCDTTNRSPCAAIRSPLAATKPQCSQSIKNLKTKIKTHNETIAHPQGWLK